MSNKWLDWNPAGQELGKSIDQALTELSKPSFGGFVGASLAIPQNSGVVESRPFPHCPRCASYALYRQNNVGDYECLTCELKGIAEGIARRTQ